MPELFSHYVTQHGWEFCSLLVGKTKKGNLRLVTVDARIDKKGKVSQFIYSKEGVLLDPLPLDPNSSRTKRRVDFKNLPYKFREISKHRHLPVIVDDNFVNDQLGRYYVINTFKNDVEVVNLKTLSRGEKPEVGEYAKTYASSKSGATNYGIYRNLLSTITIDCASTHSHSVLYKGWVVTAARIGSKGEKFFLAGKITNEKAVFYTAKLAGLNQKYSSLDELLLTISDREVRKSSPIEGYNFSLEMIGGTTRQHFNVTMDLVYRFMGDYFTPRKIEI